MGVEDKLRDSAPEWLYFLHYKLHGVLPIVLLALFLLLTTKILYDIKHPALSIVELAIIGYFVAEILVDFLLYENKRVFLKDYWINILLILPFLAAFRFAGRLAHAANAARSLEMFAGLSEVSATVRAGRFGSVLSRLPTTQKALHMVVDMPKALKKLKKIKGLKTLMGVFLYHRVTRSEDEEEDRD